MVFVFGGHGAALSAPTIQQLLQEEPTFAAILARCDDEIQTRAGWSLLHELQQDVRLDETVVSQLALCSLQMGLVGLLETRGIVPQAVVGLSAGTPATACAAGILSLPDALTMSHQRGRLLAQYAVPGRMLAVFLSEAEVADAVAHMDGVAIACWIGPQLTVLSGPCRPLDEYAEQLQADGVFSLQLPLEHCLHHPSLHPMEADAMSSFKPLAFQSPRIPLMSTVDGEWLGTGSGHARTWWDTILRPVRFLQAIRHLVQDGFRTFVEITPNPGLCVGIDAAAADMGIEVLTLPTLVHGRDGLETLGETVDRLYSCPDPVARSASPA